MATRIQVRRDTAAAWTSANPTLRAGEIGLDTTAGRWKVGDGTTAWATLPYQVAGPSSATDNALVRFDGTTGRLLQNSTVTADDNGRLTAATGATGGLAIGAPLHLTGTGSPEGVVTAPVGSTWTDTNVTTGCPKWHKRTGTGNAGWFASADADTGSRNVTAGIIAANGFTGANLFLRRIGNTVQLHSTQLARAGAGVGAFKFYDVPTGFRPPVLSYYQVLATTRLVWVTLTGDATINNPSTYEVFTMSYLTSDAWPATLP